MKEYHKIQTAYLRDPENNYKTLLEGQWAKPEFELLKDIEWVCTEKVDGTNIRVVWNPDLLDWEGDILEFRGKTDKAQIPAELLNKLRSLFTPQKMQKIFPEASVCLYGEGYGRKIQKGGNYIKDGVNFILFDIRVDGWWLTRESVESIAGDLGIKVVPIMGRWTLEEAIEFTRKGFKSTISENKDYTAEGLIMKPKLDLTDRAGHRIISKIKHKDFQK